MSHVAMDTNNPLGQRPFSVMGHYFLGAVPATPGDYDNKQPVLNELVAMGAITAQNASDIFDGKASLDDMAVSMTTINQALSLIGMPGAQVVQPLPMGTSTPSTSAPVSPVPPMQQGTQGPGQSPAGTKVLYTVSWAAGLGNLSVSTGSAISQLGSALTAHGMSVAGSTVTSSGPFNYGIQVNVVDSVGHALLSDVKSVLDGIMQQIVGNHLTGSQMSVATAFSLGTPNPLTDSTTLLLIGGAAVLGLILFVRR